MEGLTWTPPQDIVLGSVGPFICLYVACYECLLAAHLDLFFLCTLSPKSIPWIMLILGKSSEQKLIGE